VEAVRWVLIFGSVSTVWRIRPSKRAVRRWRWRPALTRCGRKALCVPVREDGQTEKSACLGIVWHIADVRLMCFLTFHHTRNACLCILHRWSPCYRRLLPDTTTALHTPALLQIHALHSSAHWWISALFTPLVFCLQTSRALHEAEYSL
jgi:hypothetical protein